MGSISGAYWQAASTRYERIWTAGDQGAAGRWDNFETFKQSKNMKTHQVSYASMIPSPFGKKIAIHVFQVWCVSARSISAFSISGDWQSLVSNLLLKQESHDRTWPFSCDLWKSWKMHVPCCALLRNTPNPLSPGTFGTSTRWRHQIWGPCVFMVWPVATTLLVLGGKGLVRRYIDNFHANTWRFVTSTSCHVRWRVAKRAVAAALQKQNGSCFCRIMRISWQRFWQCWAAMGLHPREHHDGCELKVAERMGWWYSGFRASSKAGRAECEQSLRESVALEMPCYLKCAVLAAWLGESPSPEHRIRIHQRSKAMRSKWGVELQKSQRFEVYMSLLTECFRLKEIETYHFYVDIEMHVEKQNDSTLVGFKWFCSQRTSSLFPYYSWMLIIDISA